MKKSNPYDEKFSDPNMFFNSLTSEIKYRLSNLELDLVHINDTELKGMAQQLYTELSLKYFQLLKDDLTLQRMYADIDYEEEEDL